MIILFIDHSWHHIGRLATRKAVDLETHWKPGYVRPAVTFSLSEKKTDADFTRLLNLHPVPESYNAAHSVSITEEKKVKAKNIKKL